jgi:hypothetical protein
MKEGSKCSDAEAEAFTYEACAANHDLWRSHVRDLRGSDTKWAIASSTKSIRGKSWLTFKKDS